MIMAAGKDGVWWSTMVVATGNNSVQWITVIATEGNGNDKVQGNTMIVCGGALLLPAVTVMML